MGALTRLLLRNGLRRGLIGGSRPWLVLGGVGATVQILRKLAGNEPKVVFSEKLEPGETFVIAHGRDARIKG